MTPGRHVERLALLATLALLLGVALWIGIALLRPDRERPADIPPTPALVTTTPIPSHTPLTVATPPSLGPTAPPENILTTPTPAPAATVAPTVVPPSATPTPERTPVQKG